MVDMMILMDEDEDVSGGQFHSLVKNFEQFRV